MHACSRDTAAILRSDLTRSTSIHRLLARSLAAFFGVRRRPVKRKSQRNNAAKRVQPADAKGRTATLTRFTAFIRVLLLVRPKTIVFGRTSVLRMMFYCFFPTRDLRDAWADRLEILHDGQ